MNRREVLQDVLGAVAIFLCMVCWPWILAAMFGGI